MAKYHRNIKVKNHDKRKNCLESEPNIYSTKWSSEKSIALEMRNSQIQINEPVYLGYLILDLSNIQMSLFGFRYFKEKGKRAIDPDSFIIHINEIFIKILQKM